jgi:hypothetical protein
MRRDGLGTQSECRRSRRIARAFVWAAMILLAAWSMTGCMHRQPPVATAVIPAACITDRKLIGTTTCNVEPGRGACRLRLEDTHKVLMHQVQAETLMTDEPILIALELKECERCPRKFKPQSELT